MYIVYVLQSIKDNKRYIGVTKDFPRRFNEHNNGLVKSTKNRRPLHVVYQERFSFKKEALKREKFFKSGVGRMFLKSLNI